MRIVLIISLLLSFSSLLLSQESKKKKLMAGNKIFGKDMVHEIKISFLQCEAWDSLVAIKELRDSLEIKRYLQGNVEVNGEKFYSCGVRIKGESSYDYYPGRKKSFKINFGKFIKKQKLNGLKTINLNNAFKDPSFMREKLYLDFMRNEELAVPRCTYANVYVNGELWGLYTLVEEINKGFVERNFGNKDGAFFKGEPKATFQYIGENKDDYRGDYRLKSMKMKAYNDLLYLIRVLNSQDVSKSDISRQFDKLFNVKDCLKVFAITSLFMNVDAINLLYPHNYYLYKNTNSNKFEWIPYDGNYSFCAFSPEFSLNKARNLSVFYISDRFENPLLRVLFGIEKYRAFYIRYIRKLLNKKFTEPEMNKQIEQLTVQIRKHVYHDTMKMYSNADFEKNLTAPLGHVNDPGAFIPGLKSFVHHRIKAVKKELDLKEEQKD